MEETLSIPIQQQEQMGVHLQYRGSGMIYPHQILAAEGIRWGGREAFKVSNTRGKIPYGRLPYLRKRYVQEWKPKYMGDRFAATPCEELGVDTRAHIHGLDTI